MDRAHKLEDQFLELNDLISYVKLHIKGNLIVSASTSVKLFTYVAYPVDEIGFNKAVYPRIQR